MQTVVHTYAPHIILVVCQLVHPDRHRIVYSRAVYPMMCDVDRWFHSDHNPWSLTGLSLNTHCSAPFCTCNIGSIGLHGGAVSDPAAAWWLGGGSWLAAGVACHRALASTSWR